jgi:hypothetical protein
MKRCPLRICALKGRDLLIECLRSGSENVYFSAEQLASETGYSKHYILTNIRRIRDAIQKLCPGWHLHTVNEEAVLVLESGRDPSGIDCVPKGAKKVMGLRMILQKDHPIYLEHCTNRDIYDDKRRNTHDKTTWRVHDDGLLSLSEAKVQQRTRLQRLETLQIDGKVDKVIEKIQDRRHRNQPDEAERDHVTWRELSGSETHVIAHLGIIYGEIVINRRVFASEVAFYVKSCPKQFPEMIQLVVEQEYGNFILEFYLRNPKAGFPREQILGNPETTRNIRKRLGMPYYNED